MPPEDTGKRIAELETKIDSILVFVEKMRRYMLISAVVTLLLIVLPALGLVFAIPSFLSSYQDALNGAGANGAYNLNNLRELQDLQRELNLYL